MSNSRMGKKMSMRLLKGAGKLIISSAIIWYIISKIDISEIGQALKGAQWYWLLGALGIYIVSQVAASFRLNILFRQGPIVLSQRTNLKLYWLGLFYNLFLPGGVGGDGFKVYLLKQHLKASVKKILGAIFADRLSGLAVIVAYLVVLVHFIDYPIPFQGWWFLVVPLPFLGLYLFLRWVLPGLKRAFLPICGWSILIQGLQMVSALLILEALGAGGSGDFHNYLFLFLLSAIMASIPITLGGIGAREFTFLMGAQYLNLHQEQAIALSLLFYFISAISALPGAWYTIAPAKILAGSSQGGE